MSISENDHLVRVRRPRLILLVLPGCVSPIDWEDRCILPYVQSNLLTYLTQHWTTDADLRPLIDLLREQSFNEHFVFETAEAPLVIALNQSMSNSETVLKSVTDYVLYDLAKVRSSAASVELVRKCWLQGYRNQAIKTIVFDDVVPAIKRWRSSGIKVALYTVFATDTARLLLSSTTVGNVAAELDYFVDLETVGLLRDESTFDKIATAVQHPKADTLFICDYGQDLRHASASGVSGVLIVRPGNRTNREYYLIRFPFASSFDQIEFAGAPSAGV